MPIIKSNAYGHGILEVARLLQGQVEWLGVVSASEALLLRTNGIRTKIFCLSYSEPEVLNEAIKQKIDLPVYDIESARAIENAAAKIKNNARVHIKIDTGATRLGVSPKETVSLLKFVEKLPHLTVIGIYSHFASAEDDSVYSGRQLNQFNKLLQDLPQYRDKKIHFACTAAMINMPSSNYSLARLGIGLYGLWPSTKVKKRARIKHSWMKLRPVLTWKSRIIQIKLVPTGTRVGYGGTFITQRSTRIAVVGSGYWEGYDRGLSNLGSVSIRGAVFPVIGRICMNMMMVDVTDEKKIKTGDEVELLGLQISADSIATKLKTINYEIVTRINPLLKRIVVK